MEKKVISNVSGTIVENRRNHDSLTQPKIPLSNGINFDYNYQGAALEGNDAENTPELTRPVLP